LDLLGKSWNDIVQVEIYPKKMEAGGVRKGGNWIVQEAACATVTLVSRNQFDSKHKTNCMNSDNQNRCLMKKLTFTWLYILAFLGFSQIGNAQECLLNAADLVTINMDSRCERTVTPADVLVNLDTTLCDSLGLIIEYPYQELATDLGPDRVDKRLIGYVLTWQVIDSATGNRTWGRLKVEDKFPPTFNCVDTLVSCFVAQDFPAILSDPMDNCDYPARTEILHQQWFDYDCANPDTLGRIERTIRALDVWGNSFTCNQILYIQREDLDSIFVPALRIIDCCNDSLKNSMYAEYVDGKYIPIPVINDLGESIGLVDPIYLAENGDTTYLWPNTGYCQIYSDYKDHVIETCGHSYKIRREWKVIDWCAQRDTILTQWIKIVDTMAPVADRPLDITAATKVHDCKAHVELKRPKITKECWDAFDDVEVRYAVDVPSSSHQASEFISGTIAPGKTAIIYLPAGWFTVTYTLTDGCLNYSVYTQNVYVYDNAPPTPVCDEITQVTLDPDSCWARVYAKDLDDGSHDNCCERLHFAVASMDSIDYWRNYWENYFEGCFDHYEYQDYQAYIDAFIEEWINIFVFDDYIDLTHCGSENLVLRVYEACDVPLYDDHLFYGGEHEWYWWNKSPWFMAWYMWKLDEYKHYGDPRPGLTCYEGSTYGPEAEVPITWDFPVTWEITTGTHTFCDPSDLNTPLSKYGYGTPFESMTNTSAIFFEHFFGLDGNHGPEAWQMCYWHPRNEEAQADWYSRVLVPYQTEAKVTKTLNITTPYYSKGLYADCMIEVLKDDKVPPVIPDLPNLTVYCDGVPYWGDAKLNGVDEFIWHGAQYAHDICAEEDDLGYSSCFLDDTKKDVVNLPAGSLCVKVPWDGHDFGYYGGTYFENYHSYDQKPCQLDQVWKPIYCRVWLWLDYYDRDDDNKFNPEEEFYDIYDDIYDNCRIKDIEESVDNNLNECGYGYVVKTWTATDWCDNVTTASQHLYVKPRSDFEVKFPADVKIDCNTVDGSLEDAIKASASGAGYPVITDDDCELIGVASEDQLFETVEEACYKILRTWTVIDWCVYNADRHVLNPDVIVTDTCVASSDRDCVVRHLKDDGDGIVKYTQIIKVFDHTPPTITPADDLNACINDPDCAPASIVYPLGEAVDACTPGDKIGYRYYVDPKGAGNPAQYLRGTGNVLNKELPAGNHKVYLIASDNCGNEDTALINVTVRDCKKPTPYCYHGIATVIMPTSGSVTVWAKDLDAGSYDNCTTDPNRLIFSFSEDVDDQSRVFTCDSIGQREVKVWVTDEAGNQDFCTTYLLIQNTGACPDVSVTSITGNILTEDKENVEFVEVKLMTSNNPMSMFKTGVDGKYSFGSINMGNSYTVQPIRNDDAVNGVSTLDLVAIQKHILGIEKFDTPYKVIAADINKSNSVSAVDLVELRKLILGVYETFPNNTSWRFVSRDHQFANIQSPWDFDETKTMTDLKEGINLADFVAIKVGDVNHSRQAHSLQGVEVRSNENLTFQIDEASLQSGEEKVLAVRAADFSGIEGYQFTMNLKGMTFLGFESGVLSLNADNFGMIQPEKGVITTSWNTTKPETYTDKDILFSIRVRANENVQVSKAVQFTSAITRAEAYRSGDEPMNVDVAFVDGKRIINAADFQLLQNNPNPFATTTNIGFVLPSAGEATLSILDVTGKVIKVYSNEYTKGYHQIQVSRKELPASGVLYYKLESQDYTATRKMVLVD